MGAYEIFRYERKYLISESMALAIRRFVQTYMTFDEYMGDEPIGYAVHSLYLDTPQLSMYNDTMDGLKNRHKLRIRFYDHSPYSPAFLEIKKRTTVTIHKLRAAVTKHAAERLLLGERLTPADLISPKNASVLALAEFCDRRERMSAEGTAFVSYRREAYVSHAVDGERVTFDRQVVGHEYRPGQGLNILDDEAPVAEKGVVLELKYNGGIPYWMHDLISSFGLQRISYPKYVYCVDALGMAPEMAGPFRRSVRW